MSVEVIPLEGIPEVRPGDDLVSLLEPTLRGAGATEGDIVLVTQKIVSKAEGRVVSAVDRASVVEAETVRVVARRDDLVIAQTRHGFVCANAGVDASNVDAGTLALLPEDPDASATALRAGIAERLGIGSLGVVVSDTFGRPWRTGLVNVAIGCAGLPALIDLRGRPDDRGRALEATIVALADEVAAAGGLVMGKDQRIPAAIVRGVDRADAPDGAATDLVRPSDEDLFRESPMQALHARRTIRSFGSGAVPRAALEAAVLAACTAPAPHHTRPWRFTVLESSPAKRMLLAAMAQAWRDDLRRDGLADEVIARRVARSDEVLGRAPVLIVPWLSMSGAHAYPDAERSRAEREMFLLSGGAAIQTLLLALHAHGLASCWISSTLFCQDEARATLGVGNGWSAMGTIACGGPPDGGAPPPRSPIELADVAEFS